MGNDIKQYFAGKVIKVDRGGPESRIGKLLDASDDYFTVLTENDGVVYYHTRHVKSFTENTKGQLKFDLEVSKDFEFKKAGNFKELLKSLKYVWVKINRGGPDTVEGVLTDVKNDFVYVITNEEIVRITIFHIKNVSYGVNIEKAESEDHNSREHKVPPHKLIQPESLSCESSPFESIQHASLPCESSPFESIQPESLPYESSLYESIQPESSPYESLPFESRQKSNNKINRVDKQNLEDDLSVLLSSMEKFLRNYSN